MVVFVATHHNPQITSSRPTLAELITQEIVSLHDTRARKHDCPGYDCATCSLHALQSQIEEIVNNGMADFLAALKAAYSLFEKDHALSRFDWGRSNLRAADIRELNDTPLLIAKAIVKAGGM